MESSNTSLQKLHSSQYYSMIITMVMHPDTMRCLLYIHLPHIPCP